MSDMSIEEMVDSIVGIEKPGQLSLRTIVRGSISVGVSHVARLVAQAAADNAGKGSDVVVKAIIDAVAGIR